MNKKDTIIKVELHSNPPFRHGAQVGIHIGASPIIFQRAKALRAKMTEAETILWEELKNDSLRRYKFRRQHPVLKYEVDFYCHECKLVVEVDGAYHYHQDQMELDRIRSMELKEYGLSILRFSNEEIKKDIYKVKNRIREEILKIKEMKTLCNGK